MRRWILVLIGALGCDDASESLPPADAAVDAATDQGPPSGLALEIAADAPVATVDPRFLSFAVDASQVVGGNWWDPDAEGRGAIGELEVDPFDFTREALINLTAPLAPAFLRIGGSEADAVYYDFGDAPDPLPEGYDHVFTQAQFDGLNAFAQALDLDVMFNLNAGPGPRDADRVWHADQAERLIEYAVAQGYDVPVWELGNEINGFLLFHGFAISGEAYAADLAEARAVLDRHAPEAILTGPSAAYWPVVGELAPVTADILEADGGASIGVITWHFYPQQSVRCPVQSRAAGPEVMLTPAALNEVAIWAAEVEAHRDAHAPGVPIWLGETGNAQCGGAPGVSDRFAGSFWWLDQLGTLARRGHAVVVRQTLSGSNYGLLGELDLFPSPDYWASVLWKRLMGETVLAVEATDGPDTLRTYAHCAPGGGVTALAINIDTAPVEVHGAWGAPEVYLVEADGLDAREVRLNGVTLTAADDGTLPTLPSAPGGRSVTLPGRSYAFLHWPSADAAACR